MSLEEVFKEWQTSKNTDSAPLLLNEPAIFLVRANQLYNGTGIQVEPGEQYLFKVPGGQSWHDATIRSGPDGWDTDDEQIAWYKKGLIKQMEAYRRLPKANWLSLIGSIGTEGDNLFFIGRGGKDNILTPNRSGVLYAFANDILSKYSNNKGEIYVSITKIK